MQQQTFATAEYELKKRMTRRERFLDEMEQVVPWKAILASIEPHYPTRGRRGRQPISMESMLRIYLMQQWYAMSDPAMEDALYEIEPMRRFANLSLLDSGIPDETTILNFRHLLEKHELTSTMLEIINKHLEDAGVAVSSGSMVDATIIHAPSSTKNKAGERDPEMHQTRKGNQWHFGMKIHVGADVNSGAVHSVTVTAANESDIGQLDELLREDDKAIFGDAAYGSDERKRDARAEGKAWRVNDKRKPKNTKKKRKNLSSAQKKRNRQNSRIRARVEHVFRVLKCQFGYRKVRYKGLKKNAAQVNTLIGLVNLYTLRKRVVAS